MESKKSTREAKLLKAGWIGSKLDPNLIEIEITKHGEGSYRFSPLKPLTAGEYAFSPTDSQECSAFGIDHPADFKK